MAGTNKRLSAGFTKFNHSLFGDCKRIMYSKSEKAVYCPECESISRISSPTPPRKKDLFTDVLSAALLQRSVRQRTLLRRYTGAVSFSLLGKEAS